MALEQNDRASIRGEAAKRPGFDLRNRGDSFPLATQTPSDSFEVRTHE